MNPRTQQRQATQSRADILQAAIDTIAERGCHGATISRIAKKAHLSTAAVFWHFQDKSGLLKAVAAAFKDSWIVQVKLGALAQSSGLERLEALVTNHRAWVAEGAPEMQAFVLVGLEARGLGEFAAAEYVAEMLQLWERFLAELIRGGQQDGSLPASADPERTAHMLANWLLGAIVRRSISGDSRTHEGETVDVVRNIFWI